MAQWLNRHESEQTLGASEGQGSLTPGASEGQGSLECCSLWGNKVLLDMAG